MTEVPVLAHRVDRLEQVVERIDRSLDALVRLEERHLETRNGLTRIHDDVEACEARIRALEVEMMSMRTIRKVFWWLCGAAVIAVLQILSDGKISLW